MSARKKPTARGRHERLEEIWLRLFDIIHNELSNYESPLTVEDREGIRGFAREMLTLMDKHEEIDRP